MTGPYGLQTTETCGDCKLRGDGFFCQFSQPALRDLQSIKYSSAYPQGAVLFMEKEAPRGVYVICEGQIKLTISSSEGKTLILRIAKAGDVIGLASAVSGMPHKATAEVLHPSHVAFIRREDFLHFLAQHSDVARSVIAQVSSQYQTACEQIRTLGLSASVPEKVAKLLLGWSAGSTRTRSGAHITMPLTHEEIAEFIGTTRESVTRTLSDFKRRQLIELHGSSLTITSRTALEEYAHA